MIYATIHALNIKYDEVAFAKQLGLTRPLFKSTFDQFVFVTFIVVPPLVLLIVGVIVGWIVAAFRRA
jgi:hypothetical protein